VLPALIRLIARLLIEPGGGFPFLAFVSLGSIIPAWVWAGSMIERFQIRSFWRNYVVTCLVFGLIVAAAFLVPQLVG